jgi:hypothetical protein
MWRTAVWHAWPWLALLLGVLLVAAATLWGSP